MWPSTDDVYDVGYSSVLKCSRNDAGVSSVSPTPRAIMLGLVPLALFLAVQLCLAENAGQLLVYPKLLESRSGDSSKFLRVTDDLILNLQRASVLGDTFTMTTSENGRLTTETIRGDLLNQHLYEDVGHKSSLVVHERSDGLHVRGLLTPTMRIEPLPLSPRSEDGRVAHVISRSDHSTGPYDDIESKIQLSLEMDLNQTCPEIIEPEVHVVSEWDISKSFTSKYHMTLYVMTFFHSVNLRFSQLHFPKIKFRLVGFYAGDRGVQKKILGGPPRKSHVDVRDLVKSLKSFMWPSHPQSTQRLYFGNADIVYFMTNITDLYDGNRGPLSPPGFAEQNGICEREKSIVIGTDDGKFAAGVPLAARLLARAMGAPYDKEKEGCRWEDGYIMGNFDKDSHNHNLFSSCSLKSMVKTLVKKASTCFNFSEENYPVLPGDLYKDRNEFCKFAYPSQDAYSCPPHHHPDQCKIYCCVGPSGRQHVHKAPDGTPCTTRSYGQCVKGKCNEKKKRKWMIYFPFPSPF